MNAEIAVIGAGVIGLAIARKLSGEGRSVVLLEKETRYGTGISSRNTEVIHAGIYYEKGSLKASMCVRGKELLYEHCEKYKVKHKRIGKLFIAVNTGELTRLELTKRQGMENGVDDLVEIDKRRLSVMEPEINAIAALFSPSSGVIDSHGFMKSLLTLGQADGMMLALGSPVLGAEPIKDGWRLKIGGEEKSSFNCNLVINAAGLYSIDIANKVFPGRQTPRPYPSKGSYIRYSGKSPVGHIIYPAIMPGLIEERADATPDITGSLRFGPSVEPTKGLEDFDVDPKIVGRMARGIKRYLPDIDITRLNPDCSGIRPKIYGPKDRVEDFRFDWAPVEGWLDLWGIESPGLTASLAIAEYASNLISERGYFNKKREVMNEAA